MKYVEFKGGEKLFRIIVFWVCNTWHFFVRKSLEYGQKGSLMVYRDSCSYSTNPPPPSPYLLLLLLLLLSPLKSHHALTSKQVIYNGYKVLLKNVASHDTLKQVALVSSQHTAIHVNSPTKPRPHQPASQWELTFPLHPSITRGLRWRGGVASWWTGQWRAFAGEGGGAYFRR